MKKHFLLLFSSVSTLLILFSGCQKQLDLVPTNDITSEKIYSTAEGYTQVMAKVYGSFATTGNQGPAGQGDISGDEGFSDFNRTFWYLQELSTEEAIWSYYDNGATDFHDMKWTSTNAFVRQLYRRSYFQIVMCNEFIGEASDSKLSDRGIGGADATKIKLFREEARFLRAFQYWVLMDLYGNVPFVTSLVSDPPPQKDRKFIFNFVESELKDLENKLSEPRGVEYGRVDKGSVWALLSRMYLNAEVYTGENRYTDAITYAQKVIDNYTLNKNYGRLFMADNHLFRNEMIFAIPYDGLKTQGYGGANTLIHGSIFPNAPLSMKPADYGVSTGWNCLRTTKNLPMLFTDSGFGTNKDTRAMFHRTGATIDIAKILGGTDGYKVVKYKNIDSSGLSPRDKTGAFVDVDMPLFRAAEMYLIYAEATLRGGAGGSLGTALELINKLRTRAYGDETGNITPGELTLDFIIDERGRELYWEGHRRTDLIRFRRFTESSYLWPFKGGALNGKGVSSHLNIYPIPSTDLTSNPNLKQNPGY